jgi:predicted transcriptional regulator
MIERTTLSPSLLRRAQKTELSLGSLEAIAAIRGHLDELESAAMLSARDKGATLEDIAEALGLTPQAIYYRLRNRPARDTGSAHGRPGLLET